jgi:putative inorganic carbon (hco3(-)) transporter
MKPSKNKRPGIDKASNPPVDAGYSIIILAYSLVTVLTPNLNTFDSNGPKILMLAVLNLVAYGYLLLRKDFRSDSTAFPGFISNPAGMALIAFLLFSLLSFVAAINISESILQVCKVFNLLATTYILYLVFRKGEVYFRQMAFVFTLVLLMDCMTVFYNISLFIDGKLATIADIKSIYSNKNILTAAIFVKIPFALWFSTFFTGKLRTFGNFVLFLAFAAIFFMSARAFYLGSILLAAGYIVFLAIRYFREKEKSFLRQMLIFILIISSSFILYLLTQSYLYPASNDIYAESVAKRMGTITSDSASRGRSLAWAGSAIMIRENPLVGVGTGNWKIRELQYENPVKTDYKYLVKAHNDFLEVTAETGIPGGLAFLAMFIIPFIYFIRLVFRKSGNDALKLMFLAAVGILCYAVDSFFNFPADRPEIQILFASFLAGFIAYSSSFQLTLKIPGGLNLLLRTVFVVLMGFSVYIFQLNFKSLKYQRIAEEEILSGSLSTAPEVIMAGLPFTPDLNSSGEPVEVIKARYLIGDNRLDEAINLLLPYKGSPYDARREYFLAMSYGMKGMNDSALVYLERSHDLKPLNFKTSAILCKMLSEKGDQKKAQDVALGYLKKLPTDRQMWFVAIDLCEKYGNPEEALAVNDSALKYIPGDTLLFANRTKLAGRITALPGASPLK